MVTYLQINFPDLKASNNFVIPVVSQRYDTHGDQEYVIRGNSAVLKCKIPSFVADFLDIISWQDNVGNTYVPDGKSNGNLGSVCVNKHEPSKNP